MKNKLKNIMDSEKGPIKMKLFLYLFFFGFIVLFLALSGSFTPEAGNREKIPEKVQEPKKEMSFYEKQDKLINSDHAYKYVIDADNTIIFDGKIKEGIDTGYKETVNGIIKYKIVDDKIYKVTGAKEGEYDKLYQDVDEKLLSIKDIFQLINSSSSVIDRQDTFTVYNYNIEGTSYKIYTDDISVYRIEISINEHTYNYEFSY